MCLSAVLGIGSAAIGASSASSAADAQSAAAAQQLALQEDIYNQQTELFEPYYAAGTNALAAQQSLLGLGPPPTIGGTAPEITASVIDGGGPAVSGPVADIYDMLGPEASKPLQDYQAQFPNAGPTGQMDRHAGTGPMPGGAGSGGQTLYKVGDQTFATLEEAQAYANANLEGGTPYGGFQESPGYRFAFDQGMAGIDASASAGGNLYSGATMQAANQFGQGIANQEFNNYYNQVSGIAGAGQAAAGQTAQAGTNYATGGANALANMGNAQAAGSIGVGNALMGGINTGLGLYQYQNSLNTPPAPGAPLYNTGSSSLFGSGALY